MVTRLCVGDVTHDRRRARQPTGLCPESLRWVSRVAPVTAGAQPPENPSPAPRVKTAREVSSGICSLEIISLRGSGITLPRGPCVPCPARSHPLQCGAPAVALPVNDRGALFLGPSEDRTWCCGCRLASAPVSALRAWVCGGVGAVGQVQSGPFGSSPRAPFPAVSAPDSHVVRDVGSVLSETASSQQRAQ